MGPFDKPLFIETSIPTKSSHLGCVENFNNLNTLTNNHSKFKLPKLNNFQ